MADYIPKTNSELALWLKNLRTKLPTYQKNLGLSDADMQTEQKRCDELITSIEKNEQKRLEYQAQTEATRSLTESHVPALRASIRYWKARPGFKDEWARDLGLSASESTFMAQEVKPTLTVESRTGVVRIKFKKGSLDGVNVYSRMQGETQWTFLARDTHSPYDDHRPLRKEGASEVREYRIIGVIKDDEVGEPSDTVSVLYAG